MRNPFQFGRELGAAELVDRTDEVREVVRTIEEAGKLFLIGPRRYGKTSILKAASERAQAKGAVVLRYDAEAYPTLELLVQEIVADATRELMGSIERAGEWIRQFFGRLQPSASYNAMEQTWSVSLGVDAQAASSPTTLLVHALSGLERLASETVRPVAVIIDEFQHIAEREGLQAEKQLRAAVQQHRKVGYIFAGSKTRFLADMTGDPSRPFFRLGARRFIGPVPRGDFRAFLHKGLEDARLTPTAEGVEAILDAAEDVPYNVQRLASACWNELRDRDQGELTPALVREVLERIVRQDDPFYTQIWNGLTVPQQKALLAVVRQGGQGLFARRALAAADLALGTMQHSLSALESTGILRIQEDAGTNRYVFEDPFFAAWLGIVLPSAARKS